jgi:hypothetical protein
MTYRKGAIYRIVSYHPTWGKDSTKTFDVYYDAVVAKAKKLAHSPEVHFTIVALDPDTLEPYD